MLGEEDLKAHPQTTQSTVVVDDTPKPSNDVGMGDRETACRKVAETLGVKDYAKHTGNLDAIIEFISREYGAKELNDIIWEVRRLKNVLGTGYDDNPIKTLYRYVYLKNEQSSIGNELRRFKDGE